MKLFSKRDLRSVHEALEILVGRTLPRWVGLLYYIFMLPIALLLAPYAAYLVIRNHYQIKKMFKDWEA